MHLWLLSGPAQEAQQAPQMPQVPPSCPRTTRSHQVALHSPGRWEKRQAAPGHTGPCLAGRRLHKYLIWET